MGTDDLSDAEQFGVLLFHGFGLGLLGKLGVATCVTLAMAFFIVQIAISSWWLRHFAMGPTHLKLQPLARPALPAT